MRRREFIAGVAGAAAWPLVARAQQPDRIRRIGVLMSGDENARSRSAFTEALADLGGPMARRTYGSSDGPAAISTGYERSRGS
jgi:putative tryptophan/tyrosine transport system substrate-binding protein